MAVTIDGNPTFPLGTPYLGSAPNPAYSGTFVPAIWSGKLLVKFYESTVLAAIANTDYEGEIQSHGDKVFIRQIPEITIRDYQAHIDLVTERPSADVVTLVIDKAKYWMVSIDDVFKKQSDLKMVDMWAMDAAERLKITVDAEVLANMPTGVDALNKGLTAGRVSGNINLGVTGTPIVLTSVNVIDTIVNMGQALDEQNVPQDGRYMIIPSWVSSLIKRSELRDASLSGDGVSLARNGRLGTIDRFTLYLSNQLPKATTETTLLAGHPSALTFASQLTNLEQIRTERSFGDNMRGLQVFGYKVVKGESAVAAVCQPA